MDNLRVRFEILEEVPMNEVFAPFRNNRTRCIPGLSRKAPLLPTRANVGYPPFPQPLVRVPGKISIYKKNQLFIENRHTTFIDLGDIKITIGGVR